MHYLQPAIVTFSGLDSGVDFHEAASFSSRFEWAILVQSPTKDEKPRYPSKQWRQEFRHALGDKLNIAYHFCGHDYVARELAGINSEDLWGLSRVQLNFQLPKLLEAMQNYEDVFARKWPSAYEQYGRKIDVFFAAYVIGKYARSSLARTTIIQYNEHNEQLTDLLRYVRHSPAISALIDGSLGTGKSPDGWKLPPVEHRFWSHGFAGGLGPHNIANQLPLIAEAAETVHGRPYWIDMETGIRENDKFSFAKANDVANFIVKWSFEAIRHG